MEKYYTVGNKTYRFISVHMEAGMLYGYCPARGLWAWLDPNGVQFEGERRQPAQETKTTALQSGIPAGCHYWGGQLRNNAAWRAAHR